MISALNSLAFPAGLRVHCTSKYLAPAPSNAFIRSKLYTGLHVLGRICGSARFHNGGSSEEMEKGLRARFDFSDNKD